jgi:hypothetical protein
VRTTLRQISTTQCEIWRGHNLAATIYASPGGLTIQACQLEPQDVDVDGQTVHVDLQRGDD